MSVTLVSLFMFPVSVWARGVYPCVFAGIGSGAYVASAVTLARVTPHSLGRVESGVQVSAGMSVVRADAGVHISSLLFLLPTLYFGSSSVPLRETFPFSCSFSPCLLLSRYAWVFGGAGWERVHRLSV